MEKIDAQIEKIESEFETLQKNFDEAHELSREMIRNAAKMITYIHNDNTDGIELVSKAIEILHKKLKAFEGRFRYIVIQAYQEMAEARIFYDIKINEHIPTPDEIDIDYESYILGLMDVVGELKRELLNALRKNCIDDAKKYFDFMEYIYDSTRSIRFAEAILPGFRKKQDVARIQIENAGSDILKHDR